MELNPGYKHTDVGVIPEDWEVRRLGDIADIVMGQSPSSSNYNRRGDGLPLIQGNADVVDRRTIIRNFTTQITKRGRENDVLMSVRAPVGEISRTLFDVCLGRGVCAIRFPNDFIYHFLIFSEPNWAKHSKGSTFDSVNSGDVNAVEVGLPPDAKEQIAIATALSDADALLEGLNRLIAKKLDLKQAVMQQLLTGKIRLPEFCSKWKIRRLGDYVTFLRNGVNSRAELLPEGRIKYLHYGDVHASKDIYISTDSLSCLPDAKATSLDRLQEGDLIFADASEDIAGVSKSVEIKEVGSDEFVSGLHPIAARFDKKVLADGFKGYLQFCPSFVNQLRRLAAGTKVYATNRAHIANIEMHLPSIHEQTAIGTVLSDMDAEIAALEARREKTRNLKQAMMQELLSGKTRLVTPGGVNV